MYTEKVIHIYDRHNNNNNFSMKAGLHYKEDVEIATRRVTLTGFRNFAQLDLEIEPGFNVICGPNAQGKTNLLEAIYLVSTTRLLRGHKDTEAIRDLENRAHVQLELAPHGTLLGVTLERGVRKRASLNGMNLPRASDLMGRLPCVCISTIDLELVRGDPAERRMFLDVELSILSPAYLRHLTMYKRALDQRNALLKASREWTQPAEVFEVWEKHLAEHGAALRAARVDFVAALYDPAQSAHERIGGGENLEVSYIAKDDAMEEEALMTLLAQTRSGDVLRGSTTVGPHRDDLGIEVAKREARLFGSQGQQRTSVIALKLATLEVAKYRLGSVPLLLLDDMLSDLDQDRRALLVDVILDLAGQAVLTCTEAESAGERILERASIFQVRAGTVTPS